MSGSISSVGGAVAAIIAVVAAGCGVGEGPDPTGETSSAVVASAPASVAAVEPAAEDRVEVHLPAAEYDGWILPEGERPAPRMSAEMPDGLPPSARQTREGYWLGAMIGPEDVPTLGRMGIRAVLSAEQPDDFTVQFLEDYGIEQVPVPMSDAFLHAETILDVADRFAPSEIYIHCRYGADRTGVIAAFLLVMRHYWLVQDAFYAVLAPTADDTAGLAAVLASYDLPDYRDPGDPSVGFYSVVAAGGNGGLKARGSGYVRLISTTLDAIERHELAGRGEDFVPWDGSIDVVRPDEPFDP